MRAWVRCKCMSPASRSTTSKGGLPCHWCHQSCRLVCLSVAWFGLAAAAAGGGARGANRAFLGHHGGMHGRRAAGGQWRVLSEGGKALLLQVTGE